MENTHIADILNEIADLLELQDANPFRVRSYRSAARSVRGESRKLQDMIAEENDLTELSNIGDSTAETIRQIVQTGTCKRLQELRDKVPAGLTDVMRVEGVGPKKAMKLHDALNIDSIDSLKKAAENHDVRTVEGFGEKTEQKILQGIQTLRKTRGRILYSEAVNHVQSLREHLDSLSSIQRWEAAGSFRRARETIGDLDILVQAKDRSQALEEITEYDAVADVAGKGKEKTTVHLDGGLQVDFRFFDPKQFGAAMMYFTGSKAHNIALRRIAQEKDWKLNEYGLFAGKRLLAGKNEQSVYSRLGLDWIPPELREDQGEIEAACNDELPSLVKEDDLRGDLQSHTTASDGQASIREMAETARDHGHQYFAITDHSKRVTMAQGLDDDACLKHAENIRRVNDDIKNFRLLAGIEVDILKSGILDLKHKTLEQLDWVVASIHYDRNLSESKMTERILQAIQSGVVHCLGHPLGRIIGKREPLSFDFDKILDACREHNVALEINAQPDRLDLPDSYCRRAKDAGVRFTIGTDAHAPSQVAFLRFGVNVARRGWLKKSDVLNTKTVKQLEKAIKRS